MAATIAGDEVQRRLAEGAQLLEVLPAEEYQQLHIAGAINMPLKELEGEAPPRQAGRAGSSWAARTA